MTGPIGYELSAQAARASQIVNSFSFRLSLFNKKARQKELLQIIELMDVEIASRGKSIRTMNEILGYNNDDGHSSEPSPHDIAKRLVEAAARLAGFAASDLSNQGHRQRALDEYRRIYVPKGVPA